MVLLAYGGFQSSTYWGMLYETLPFCFRIFFYAFVSYAVCSLIAENVRFHIVAVLLFILSFGLIVPTLSVGGAYGPAHVGLNVGIWSWPFFGLLILAKTFGLSMGLVPRGRLWHEFMSSRCADRQRCITCDYDLRSGHDRCPECGTPVPTHHPDPVTVNEEDANAPAKST